MAVSVFVAEAKVADKAAVAIARLAEIVFAVETIASKRDLARVRKTIGDKIFRNQCRAV